MPNIKLTDQAIADISDIAEYGIETWGKPRRDTFIDDLYKVFDSIAETPLIGSTREDVKAGYRCRYLNPYTIFYIVLEKQIDIIGVVHQSRDISNY